MLATPAKRTLSLFNSFIARTMGLHIRNERLPELAQRVAAACRDFGHEDPEACMLWLMSAPLSREQLEILARALTIGETYFLRDPRSYRALEEHVLPELISSRRKGEKSLRIWSAGCSTGEEPYSIAILLSRIIPDLGSWNIVLLATDINPDVLERGRQGVYGQWSFRDAPPWLMDYFKKRQDGRFEIVPRIRKMVQFNYLNLAEDSYPALINNTNAIDIIFCRNVMLYFEPAMIRSVTAKFHDALLEGGWLFVSPTEIAHRSFAGFTCRSFSGALAFRKGADDVEQGGWPAPAALPPATTFVAAAGTAPAPALPHCPAPAPLLAAIHGPEEGIGAAKRDGSGSTPPPDAYLEAVALYAAGRYEPAAAKISEFLASRQDDADAMELLAKAYANLGKFVEAGKCCEAAIAADKLRASNHYLLSIILLEQGEIAEAAAALKRALYIDHDFVVAHFALGNLNRQAGRQKESKRDFANALHLLERRDPHEVLPEAEGMTAGRLAEIIRAMTAQESLVNGQ